MSSLFEASRSVKVETSPSVKVETWEDLQARKEGVSKLVRDAWDTVFKVYGKEIKKASFCMGVLVGRADEDDGKARHVFLGLSGRPREPGTTNETATRVERLVERLGNI